ncbi:MAG TPA: putative porin [Terriglobales bacterium]|nr:putative porin [Terriglobales bacterium]
MKRLLTIAVLVVVASTLWGQTSTAKKRPVKKAEPAITAEDVKALRDALAAQQQQIEQLRQELRQRDAAWQAAQQRLDQAANAAAEAQTKAVAAQSAADSQKETYEKLSSDVKDLQGNMTTAAVSTQEDQKRVSAVEGLVSRFRFSGDVRVRQEDFFQSYSNCGSACNARIRERIRVRFGFEGKAGEDFTGGIFLASGAFSDPTSTNQTLSDVFERKTIGIDRAYINYNPSAAKFLTLTGGKFAYTWIRTPASFDNDLNPEGFSEKFSFDLNSPLLKNVTFTGMQLLFNEANRPSSSTSCINGICANGGSITGGDSFAAGGQVSAKLQLTKRWSLTPSYSILNWRNNDVILNESAVVNGGSAGQFAPNGITNATVTLGTAGGVSIRRFYSKFLYSDLILDNNISTGWAKLPTWRVVLEYLNNLNAQDHPLLADGTVATDLGKQSHYYKVETSLGSTKNKGDFQFNYGFWRQEQDSVIASFNESDQRAPTNIIQHTFGLQYKVRNNTTLAFTQWIGRTLNSNLQNRALTPGLATGDKDPYLKRMQFDVIYSF